MQYGIVAGSHRKDSQSSKVASFIARRIQHLPSFQTGEKSSTYSLDLGSTPLPLWDESNWSPDGEQKKLFAPDSEQLTACEAFIIITPEWSGMVPSALKNLFLLAGNNEFANKPALIVSISAGSGGSYPVTELRMSSYKNTRICYIPDHLVIRQVGELLNDQDRLADRKEDFYIKERLDYCLNVLHQYALALKQVRSSAIFDYKKYPFGM
jgi:NAD(P)H-dependent FMN reductase